MKFPKLSIMLLVVATVVFFLMPGGPASPQDRGQEKGPLWTQTAVLPEGGFDVIEISPHHSSILYAGANYGLFRSFNSGEGWEAINEGLDIAPSIVNNVANNLKLDAEGRYLYLGTGGRGVYRVDLAKLDL